MAKIRGFVNGFVNVSYLMTVYAECRDDMSNNKNAFEATALCQSF